MRCSRASVIGTTGGCLVNGNPTLLLDKNFRNKISDISYMISCEFRTARYESLQRDRQNGPRMIDTVTGLYYLLRVSRIKNDGIVFRLHALTMILILTFSVIITSKQVVGNPIECVHTRDIPVEAFNAYCWIHSTYFVTSAMLGVVGTNVAAPGVGPSFGSFDNDRHRNHHEDHQRTDQVSIRRVKYYQWVAFVLLFQGLMTGKLGYFFLLDVIQRFIEKSVRLKI